MGKVSHKDGIIGCLLGEVWCHNSRSRFAILSHRNGNLVSKSYFSWLATKF